jgi:hypothetical protein
VVREFVAETGDVDETLSQLRALALSAPEGELLVTCCVLDSIERKPEHQTRVAQLLPALVRAGLVPPAQVTGALDAVLADTEARDLLEDVPLLFAVLGRFVAALAEAGGLPLSYLVSETAGPARLSSARNWAKLLGCALQALSAEGRKLASQLSLERLPTSLQAVSTAAWRSQHELSWLTPSSPAPAPKPCVYCTRGTCKRHGQVARPAQVGLAG